jgi:hypothetical protein
MTAITAGAKDPDSQLAMMRGVSHLILGDVALEWRWRVPLRKQDQDLGACAKPALWCCTLRPLGPRL